MRKTLLEARGKKTQVDVANSLGITQKYLSKLELGQRNPSLKVASKISSFYKQPVEVLFPDIFYPRIQLNGVMKLYQRMEEQ